MSWERSGLFPPRELSMEEIKEIRAHIPDDLEIETFVHGAMCISYSGRCLAEQLFYRQGCEPGCLHPSVPLEVCGHGGEPSGRISSGRGK